MDPIRVLIADDHAFFRDGLRALLEAAPDTEYVGEASNGAEAIQMAEQLQPDVILMDLQMPDVNGIDATRKIVQASPHIAVLVVTMFEDDASIFSAMRAGARGYLVKGVRHAEMLRAIQAVGHGEAIFSASVAHRMMDYFASIQSTVPVSAFPELSQREYEILECIVQGKTNQEIADTLYISVKTVRNHVTNVLSKLQVADRAQAILRAREAGLS